MLKFFPLALIFFSLILFSCKSTKEVQTEPQNRKVVAFQQGERKQIAMKIISLSFTMMQNNNEKYIVFNNKTINKGILNSKKIKLKKENSFLEVQFLDKNANVLYNQKIDHPLMQSLEYTKEDSNSTQQRINQNQVEFSIQYHDDKKIESIVFIEHIKEKKNTLNQFIVNDL